MIETLRNVLEGALQRLRDQITTFLPPLLAALTLFLAAYAIAVLVRWMIYRIFKGLAIDKFLRQSGLAFMVDPSGRLRATRIAAETAFWGILLTGILAGLNLFGTDLTTHMIEGFVLLLPKIVLAGLILLGGTWLGQYLSRSMLVWAVNENLPKPRTLATIVRVLITFVAVVVAADRLDFARNVFFAAFIIVLGGAALTASLAFGLRRGRAEWLPEKGDNLEESPERSLWNHL